MAPFRQQPPFYKDDEEEDDDADDEVDGDEDDVLAPSAGPGNAVQRPAITNTAGLAAALDDIAWPSTVTWVDTLVVRGQAERDGVIANIQDDLERESVFHRRAQEAVASARVQLGALGVPTRRPDDFYAEMVKNDVHMRKVKDKLLFEQRQLDAKAERRRVREAKRYGKAVQAERLKERKQQQKASMGLLQRMKKRGAGVSASDVLADEPDWDALGQGSNAERQQRRREGGSGNAARRRAHKASKYGFGGRKRGSKRNDAQSTADVSGYRVPRKQGERGGRGGGNSSGRRKVA